MRQLVFQSPGSVGFESTAEPTLSDQNRDAAIVRPLAMARCDLDIAMAAFGVFPGPYPVGHELVAEVVATGEEVTRHRPGDRVVVPFQVSCGTCPACLDGRYAACIPHRARAGSAFGFGEAGGGHGGAIAERLLVPHADHMLLAAPEGLSDEALCTLPDNVLDAWRTVAGPLEQHPEAEVLIIGGAGASIGLATIMIATALGASKVRYVDSDPARLAHAERLGAEVTEHQGDWPKRFPAAPVTIENSGSPQGLACALRSTDAYGTCTPVAIHFAPETPVPLLEMYTRGITFVIGRADSRRYLPDVLAAAAAHRFDPLALEPTVVDFADAAEAWLMPATKLIVRGAP